MSIFLTSDTHFGHHQIIPFCNRPWKNREEMHEGLIERWNSVVKPDDTVMILGDFSFEAEVGSRRERKVTEGRISHARRLNGRKYLTPGNHDRFHPDAFPKDWELWLDLYRSVGIEPKQTTMLLTVNDPEPWQIVTSHMPYQGESTDTRFESTKLTRAMTHDLPMLHGHVHQEWKQKGNMLNVGVDVWDYYPVPIETCVELLRPYRKA